MRDYFKKALAWTFGSQVIVPVALYIIAIPLINAVTDLDPLQVWFGFTITIVLKYFNVHSEFHYRFANRGSLVWIDRLARFVMLMLILQALIGDALWIGSLMLLILVMYNSALSRRAYMQPIPYEHFIALEENRMMRFYRFANYFTDVPHLRGSIRRRAWLDFLYRWIPFKRESTQTYLVFRTFIRTDDHFYLWVRLTAISAIIAAFVNIPIVTWIVAGALAFATTIQLKYALLSSGEFRMDMLYPVPKEQRVRAVETMLRFFMVIQAAIVTICSVTQPLFLFIPLIILLISELTLRLTKNPDAT